MDYASIADAIDQIEALGIPNNDIIINSLKEI